MLNSAVEFLPHVCLVIILLTGSLNAWSRCPLINSLTKNKTTQTTFNVESDVVQVLEVRGFPPSRFMRCKQVPQVID